jgi:kinesin family protein C2/C3
VFAEVQPTVMSALDGCNVCIFAYGQTGSGKTFTMEGLPASRGVNYLALAELFTYAATSADTSYTFTVSMLEVYNETISDLLGGGKASEESDLDIRVGKGSRGPACVYVEGLVECEVSSLAEVEHLMTQGARNRHVGGTAMNEHSSRSHLVLTVSVVGTARSGGATTHGKLNLIDLAGSERLAKTGAEGIRLKEAQNINKSLSALGDVVAALGRSQAHVPYRNSKLTFLLQDSLSASARVLMFVNVTPCLASAGESQCSLNFAGRCRAVQLGAAKKTVRDGSVGPSERKK